KSIYVSQDGSMFIGGSLASGGHGLMIGVKAYANNATNANWTGFYWGAGLRMDSNGFEAFSGSANSTGAGSVVWYRRLVLGAAVEDFTPVHSYNLTPDGSGTALGADVALAATGNAFVGSGVQPGDSAAYEIYFGIRMPAQTGTGVFLNPQGIFNAASFAPAGNPVSPGEFVTLYGSGFATQSATAQLPFPTTLAGVQVLVNNQSALLYRVDTALGRIDLVIPYEVTGQTATFVILASNGSKSNAVDILLASTSPGVFSQASNGIGAGSIRNSDNSINSPTNPVHPGDFVEIFLTGMGAVTPPVKDGFAAPTSQPLTTGPLDVYVGGAPANVVFQGLAPGFAGLYQINVQIPANVVLPTTSNAVPLAIQTAGAFTDLVDIAVTP
ncbi:MAG: hypothetical protein ABI165_22320, partial [Bryobacteraceae bacterium]